MNVEDKHTTQINVISDKIEQRKFHYGNPEKEVMNTSFSSILSSALISTNCSSLPELLQSYLIQPSEMYVVLFPFYFH